MPTLFTIGHSNRTLEALIEILRAHGVRAVADVRRFPGSRKMPWFGVESLTRALPAAEIQYLPFPQLGGRRPALPDSPNTGWRNASFRGYADYMQTPQFAEAVEDLAKRAAETPTAIMCAEAVPWRCHRSLIADALLVRGWQVLDIFDARKMTPHKLTPFAQVTGTALRYPAEAATDDPSLFA